MGDETTKFDDVAFGLREEILRASNKVKEMMNHPEFTSNVPPLSEHAGEMKANIMLAYRHLEDARMRLGKAVQAFDGGKSVYDK